MNKHSNPIRRDLSKAEKVIRTQVTGFGDLLRGQRHVATRVLANSVPKAGTNLLERVLTLVPGLTMVPRPTLLDWEDLSPRNRRIIRSLPKGRFQTAHLPAHSSLLRLTDRVGVLVILMVRDPRDVVVSHARYVTEIDSRHFSHRLFRRLPNMETRIRAVIEGVEGAVAPVDELWRRFEPWIDAPNSLVVRFEDLVGEAGGGSSQRQHSAISSILDKVGVAPDPRLVTGIARRSFSTRSTTFRRGRVGSWVDELNADHVQLIADRCGDLLARFGYEADPRMEKSGE